MIQGKNILIGITGGIAAYKIPLLVRLLRKAGANVQVILTPAAKDFVTPLTLATLSGQPIHTGFFDAETGRWNSHVELGLWADLLLIAPATANTLAKMTYGIADNYLLTVCLSIRCQVMAAPAMDLDMYRHPATQQNIERLRQRGIQIIAPGTGELASGLCGEGRMEEPEAIFAIIRQHFSTGQRFAGKKVLISAGPTYETIDPVRFIGNYSSGRMGIALAESFAQQGAEVDLVLGPTHLSAHHPAIRTHAVSSAKEMLDQCRFHFQEADITVMTAAVADFRPQVSSSQKIKKTDAGLQLRLEPTVDILKTLAEHKKGHQLLIGFALETENGEANALKKLQSKNLDFVVLNMATEPGAGFGYNTNKISIIQKDGQIYHFPLKSKDEVAADILDHIARIIPTQGQ
ncbi:bifunctional phosphopantothenoylcysteine decarboxylase/phosphopantothenate--cysteine ligase CoaBC [Bacteroidales bacterium]